MAIKFTSSPGSAYEVAVGITAEEAADAGLGIVELNYSTNPPATVYGRYKDAPKGGPLGITVAAASDTKVIAGGGVPAVVSSAAAGGGKGSAVNLNDPFVHGGTGDETIHADNSEPPVRDIPAELAAEQERSEDSIEAASTKSKK
jgi:hypothetical protein